MYAKVEPIVEPSVRKLCAHPYHNHPKGCPNLGKREDCPPHAKLVTEEFDFSKPIYMIWNVYPFGKHVRKMKKKHPDWTKYQLGCVLYWQGTARKQLKEEVKTFLKKHKGLHVSTCPEAQGVNLTETMKKIGVELEWPPKKFAYQIAIAGTKK